MVCCHEATSHYLSQCWPSSISPIWHHWATMDTHFARPQWVNSLRNELTHCSPAYLCLWVWSLTPGRQQWCVPNPSASQPLKQWTWISNYIHYIMNTMGPYWQKVDTSSRVAWCHQATSHHWSQCWPTSMSPYNITSYRPQKSLNSAAVLLWHV